MRDLYHTGVIILHGCIAESSYGIALRFFLTKKFVFSDMWAALLGVLSLAVFGQACTPSVTTVSGSHAPVTVCSGAMIFADDFTEFDLEKWQHENTLAGGGVGI